MGEGLDSPSGHRGERRLFEGHDILAGEGAAVSLVVGRSSASWARTVSESASSTRLRRWMMLTVAVSYGVERLVGVSIA